MFAICQICHEIPGNSIYYPKLLLEYLPLEGVYLGAWDLTRQHARAATKHPIFFPKSIRLSAPSSFTFRGGACRTHTLHGERLPNGMCECQLELGRCIERVGANGLAQEGERAPGLVSLLDDWL